MMTEVILYLLKSYVLACTFIGGYHTNEYSKGEKNIAILVMAGAVITLYYIVAFPFIIAYAILDLIGVVKFFNWLGYYIPIRFLFNLYFTKYYDNWDNERLQLINDAKLAKEDSIKGSVFRWGLKLLNKKYNICKQ